MLVSVLKLSYLLTPNFNYTCMFHWFVLYKYTVILKFKIEGALECWDVNPLKTKRRLLYLKTQFVPRSKHFSSRL